MVLAERVEKLHKDIISVHVCGKTCDMLNIHALSQQYGFKIIDDASLAISGKYLGGQIGSGRNSDITIFSSHSVKIITTGEGGMALTIAFQITTS